MRRPGPPSWFDRFLRWYCDPELLEEIQGDAYELYYDRLNKHGKIRADMGFIWDVIRFCRASNVKAMRSESSWGVFWGINMKLALRSVRRNRLQFIAKVGSLSICLSFALVLLAFVINETQFDKNHPDYTTIYRVGCRALIAGRTTTYAVSPLPLGEALVSEVPSVRDYTRFASMYAPALTIDGNRFEGISTFLADSSFLGFFHHKWILGTARSLDRPNQLVITKSLALRLFGRTDVLGERVGLFHTDLEVSGVVEDLPLNSHLNYQALVSWPTFYQRDAWDNINVYTYVRVDSRANEIQLAKDIDQTIDDYLALNSEELNVSVDPVLQRVDRIHLSETMEEDFATRREPSHILMIVSVVIIFLLSGILNYLNLSLAELTIQIKRVVILRAFGDSPRNQDSASLADGLMIVAVTIPLVIGMVVGVVSWTRIVPPIDPSIWSGIYFFGGVILVVVLMAAFSFVNGWLTARVPSVVNTWKVTGNGLGVGPRRLLASAQLSFSIVMIGMMLIVVEQFNFIENRDKGFDDSNVIVVMKPGTVSETTGLVHDLRSLSGVEEVASCSYYPAGRLETKDLFEVETSDGLKNVLLTYFFFDPQYPRLMDLKLRTGRWFEAQRAADRSAFVVNETAARQFGWGDTLGKKISWNGMNGEVIGIVKDFYFESLHHSVGPVVMFLQDPQIGTQFLYVKTKPMQQHRVLSELEQAFRKHVSSTIFDFEYLDSRYRSLYQNDEQIKGIIFWGMLISVVVSGLGVFSISALMLSIGQHEMGIRRVLGADGEHLFWIHLRPFLVFFLCASLVGLPASYFLSQAWLENFAYHVVWTPSDFVLPVVFAATIVFVSSCYHAWRNAQVNPVEVIGRCNS